jgi:hypothetical protein
MHAMPCPCILYIVLFLHHACMHAMPCHAIPCIPYTISFFIVSSSCMHACHAMHAMPTFPVFFFSLPNLSCHISYKQYQLATITQLRNSYTLHVTTTITMKVEKAT